MNNQRELVPLRRIPVELMTVPPFFDGSLEDP